MNHVLLVTSRYKKKYSMCFTSRGNFHVNLNSIFIQCGTHPRTCNPQNRGVVVRKNINRRSIRRTAENGDDGQMSPKYPKGGFGHQEARLYSNYNLVSPKPPEIISGVDRFGEELDETIKHIRCRDADSNGYRVFLIKNQSAQNQPQTVTERGETMGRRRPVAIK